jgi:hypothetical protein
MRALFLLLAASTLSADPARFYGFQDYDIDPRHAFVVDTNSISRVLLHWDGDRGEDPTIVVKALLHEVEYIYRPTLTTSALVLGSRISFKSDSPLTLQTWVLPASICSPSSFFYFASRFFSTEFVIAEDSSVLCFFIDNPSGADFSVRMLSKQVNFTDSRVEIWNAEVEPLPCPKNRCSIQATRRFFVRFVNPRAGFRYAMKGTFKEHEIAGACGTETIRNWEGNVSYVIQLRLWEERLVCDGAVVRAPQRDFRRLGRWAATIAVIVALGALWLREIAVNEQRALDVAALSGAQLRDGSVFLEAVGID